MDCIRRDQSFIKDNFLKKEMVISLDTKFSQIYCGKCVIYSFGAQWIAEFIEGPGRCGFESPFSWISLLVIRLLVDALKIKKNYIYTEKTKSYDNSIYFGRQVPFH